MTISVKIETDTWPPGDEYDDDAFVEADNAANAAIAALVEAGAVGNLTDTIRAGLENAGVE